MMSILLMANLTETAYYTRRTINWTILTVIAYIILRAMWGVFVIVWLTVFPPKPPPPNHAFGILPAVTFPPAASSSGQLTFKLETVEGSVPQASSAAVVYFMPKSASNLLALSKTQEFAKRLGLDPTAIQEKDSKNLYRFNDALLPLRYLRYDLISNNFTLRYDFEQDTGVFTERNLPIAEAATAESKSILQSYGIYNQDLSAGRVTVSFLRLQGDQLIPTTSQSVADVVRVDFFRRDIQGIPVVLAPPDDAMVIFYFSGSKNPKKKLLLQQYVFWPVDYQTTATYALKPSSQAWQELQSGAGYIARYPTNGTTALVRKVYIAYYDAREPQTYLQPVFVFEGDDGFQGYVPAIAAPWTEQ